MKDVTYDFLYKQELHHWWYRGRRELIHLLFTKYVNQKSGEKLRILDVGCGAGILMSELERYGDVYGIDVSPLAVEYCKKRGLVNVSVDDLAKLSFTDAHFDVVIALDVLEHIEKDADAIAEIKRVLKPDGTVVIFVPAFMGLWGEADEMGRHFRRYRKPQLLKLLTESGFALVRSSYFNTFLFLPIFIIRFISRTLGLMQKIEFKESNPALNAILTLVFSFEVKLLSWLSMPFGVSALAVAKK